MRRANHNSAQKLQAGPFAQVPQWRSRLKNSWMESSLFSLQTSVSKEASGPDVLTKKIKIKFGTLVFSGRNSACDFELSAGSDRSACLFKNRFIVIRCWKYTTWSKYLRTLLKSKVDACQTKSTIWRGCLGCQSCHPIDHGWFVSIKGSKGHLPVSTRQRTNSQSTVLQWTLHSADPKALLIALSTNEIGCSTPNTTNILFSLNQRI